MPIVSVIMPAYNAVSEISDAIMSIMEQTLSDWELIVVDDASTDGTLRLVREQFDDSRISVLSMPHNLGAGACRNMALERARGKYVAVMDADDVSLRTRLEKQVGFLERNLSIAAVGCQVVEYGDWGGPVTGLWPTDATSIARRQATGKIPIHHSTAVFRRQTLVEVGGWDAACRRAEDFGLFLKLTHVNIMCINEVLYKYKTRRPLPLSYVINDQLSHELALRRHLMRMSGSSEKDLPLEMRMTLGVLIKAGRNWLIRSYREVNNR